jgi:hypothetical protein
MRMNDSEFDKLLNYKAQQQQTVPDFPFPEPEWTKVSSRLDTRARNQMLLHWVLPASLLFMTLVGSNFFFWQKINTAQQEIADLQRKILVTQEVAATNTTEKHIHQVFDTTYVKKTVYLYDTIRGQVNQVAQQQIAQIATSHQQILAQNAMLRKELVNMRKSIVAGQEVAQTRIAAALEVAATAQKNLEARANSGGNANSGKDIPVSPNADTPNGNQFVSKEAINLNEWKDLDKVGEHINTLPANTLDTKIANILLEDDMAWHFQKLMRRPTAPIKPQDKLEIITDIAVGGQIGAISSFNGLGAYPMKGTTYGIQGVFGLNDNLKVVAQLEYQQADVRGTKLPIDKKYQPKSPPPGDFKFQTLESVNRQSWMGNIGLRYVLPFMQKNNQFYVGTDFSRQTIFAHDLKFEYINGKKDEEKYVRQPIEQQSLNNIQVNVGMNVKLAEKWSLGINAYNHIPLKKLVATPTKEYGFNAGIFYNLY